MAIKQCRECGHEVSTKADKCPNCGVKNPTRNNTLNAIIWIVAILFIIGFLSNLGGNDESSSKADKFSTLSLNVRTGPSTDYDVVTALKPGEKVETVNDSAGWEKINLIERDDKITGWASEKYLTDIAQYDDWKYKQNEKKLGINSNESESDKDTQSKNQVNWQPVLNAIEKSKQAGFLTRVDNPDRTVYVNPIIWRTINAQTKENSVKTFAMYLGYLNDMGQAVGTTVKDSQSGKTIATYSMWSGVEIK